MIDAQKLIVDVARHITDYDETDKNYQHVEWSRADLERYLEEALSTLALVDETVSSCMETVQIPNTGIVPRPDNCERIMSLVRYTDPAGRVFAPLRLKTLNEQATSINRPVCSGNQYSTAPEVKLYTSTPNFLFVDPPDCGGTLTMVCSCLPAWDPKGYIDIAKKYRPVLFELMVSLAFGTDIESVPMRERSDAHYTKGMDLLAAIKNSKSNKRQ